MAGAWGSWLTVDEYKAYARIDTSDTADDAAITEATQASMEAIQLRAPSAFAMDDADPPAPIPPPAGAHQAALLLTNRLMSRRNSPDGVVGVSDMGTATILSYDADITALLGPFTAVVVAVSTADASAVIVEKLTAAGVRATTDPGALNPPAVLVVPPRRVYNVNCGFTAIWTVHAIAPAPTGGDRTTWGQLDTLVDAIASVYAVETAQPGAYVVGPSTLPSYLVTFQEVCQ